MTCEDRTAPHQQAEQRAKLEVKFGQSSGDQTLHFHLHLSPLRHDKQHHKSSTSFDFFGSHLAQLKERSRPCEKYSQQLAKKAHRKKMDYHIGQRLSLKDQLCTIRYLGPVGDKAGEWLGVEWDDASRGKHDGTYNGKKYFKCKHSRDLNTARRSLQCRQKLCADIRFFHST